MDMTARKLLEAFSVACPKTLREEDWQRLYAFTLHVHRRHIVPTNRTVRDYLISQGCSLQKASWLSNQFHHLSDILKLYDEKDHSESS